MSTHYTMCKYDDDTGSYIPLSDGMAVGFEKWFASYAPYAPESLDDCALDSFQAGAASRDAEIAQLKNELEDAIDCKLGEGPTALSGVIRERDQLREQVAMLRNALAACKVKDEAILQENYSLALSFQPDDAALKAWLGEPVAEVDDSGVVIVCRYDYKPKDKFYSPKGLK